MKEPIVFTQNLTKSFSKKGYSANKVLDNISFSLNSGDILGLIGPNGAGKTTLLKILSTLILPDSGKANIDAHTVGDADQKIKSIIGLVSSDERSFYWRISGRQNLEFFAAMQGLDKNSSQARISELISLFNIDYAQKRFDTYSAGMKRKFSLIRAILNNPKVLLLDEPFKSLDYNSTLELKDLIQDLARKKIAIILATHNIEEAEKLCNKFLIIDQGKVLACGEKEELKINFNLNSDSLVPIYRKVVKS